MKIAINVTGSSNAPAAVEAAGRLAQSFDASLLGFYVVEYASPVALAPVPGAAMNPVMIEDIQRQEEERARIAEKQFRTAIETHDWGGRWLCLDNPNASSRDLTAHLLHLADMVVAEQGDLENDAMNWQGQVEESVVDSGRPVILYPRAAPEAIGETHALIAWKPTREAARAVHDALPFLHRVRQVTVTAVNEDGADTDNAGDSSAMLVEYLASRGINAASKPLDGVDSGDIGSALIEQAAGVDADLMVMGAYSHSRLREGLFGGVTRDVIENTTVPTLMSH